MIANLELLKQNANIIDVIGAYIPLRKEGVSYKALCPFHDERTPSFVVNPNKNLFYCFGCGESGDVIGFVQKYKRISFNEAAQEVADLCNFSLEYTKGDNEQIKAIFATLESINSAFKERLQKAYATGEKIAIWLENRGINAQIAQKYDIGYCDKPTLEQLKAYQGQERLSQAGLLHDGKCFAYERVTFGLRSDNHKLKGFSARTHPYSNFKNSAKYINSRESAIFKKSFIFYGANLAKSAIVAKNQIIICEGFLDCMAFHRFGYSNAVCTIGTAFNKAHLSHIFRLKSDCEVVFCFDNDKAGQEANMRALKVCFDNAYFYTSVVLLQSEAKDMGEFLCQDKAPKMLKINGFKYYASHALDSAPNDREKDRIYTQLQALCSSLAPFERAKALSTLKALAPIQSPSPVNKSPIAPDYSLHTEARLLATMLHNDEFATIAKNYLSLEDFSMPEAFKAVLARDYKALGALCTAPVFDSTEWSEVLEHFKKQGLKNSLQNAKNRGDIAQIALLRQRLLELEQNPF